MLDIKLEPRKITRKIHKGGMEVDDLVKTSTVNNRGEGMREYDVVFDSWFPRLYGSRLLGLDSTSATPALAE